ncbi:unnamed protein product, partial [marine sediment metagenome]
RYQGILERLCSMNKVQVFNTPGTFHEYPIGSSLLVPSADESREKIVLGNIFLRFENDSLKAKLSELAKENAQLNKENEHTRPPFPKDKVKKFHQYTLESCPDCSGPLKPCDDKESIVIQQVEIKDVPIIIEEHKGYAYWCENCQKVHYAPIPEDIVKAGLCGPSLIALVGYMKSSLHASFSTIRKFLRDVVKISISRGQPAKLISHEALRY